MNRSMTRHGRLLGAGLWLIASLGCVASVTAATRPTQLPGEVLLRYTSPAAERTLAPTVAVLGRATAVPGGVGLRRLRLDRSMSVTQAVAYLRALTGVASVQPNRLYYPTALPDDPAIGQLWAAENSSQTVLGANYPFNNPGTPGADMGLVQAWEAQTDCRGVVIAVVDSGVDYGHPDLAASMWDGAPTYPHHGWDFAADDDEPMPDLAIPEDDHGSHVAGSIGATGNNANAVSGVCWNAEIMVLRAGSFLTGLPTSAVIASIEFAVDHGASLVNLSFGGEFRDDPLFSAAIDYAHAAGVLVVAAAGNGGGDGSGDDIDGPGDDGDATTTFFPCAFPQDNVVCVTASDQAHQPTTFGNIGPLSVDLAAPGTNILGTSFAPDLDVKTGTSMAVAQVTGAAALLWAQNPAYDYRDVRAALLASGTAVPAWNTLTVTGRVVHGDGALRHLRPPTGLTFSVD